MGIMFDTLKLAERLQAGGFTPEQSKTAASAFADSIGEWFAAQQLATKADLIAMETVLRRDLAMFKTDLEAKIETKTAEVTADLVKWVVGIGFAQVAMILAVLKLV